MAESEWRSRARVVAMVDLVFASLGLLFLIATLVVGVVATIAMKHAQAEQPDDPDTKVAVSVAMWILWVILVIFAGVIILEMWLSVTLYKATELMADAALSLTQATTWRNFNVAFVIFSVLLNIFALDQVWAGLVGLFIRLGFIYIVHNFVKDLESKSSTSHSAPPLGLP